MKLERLMLLVGLSVASISVPLCAQPVYYVPQVIDGATAGGSLRSTIVLTNPSTSTATVNVALTRDDGSPLTVNFPDLNSGSQFSVTLKPNGTRILQTDGSSDGSAGAATVSANVPIGVATIVSAYDASANLVSESGTGNSMLGSAYVRRAQVLGTANSAGGTPDVSQCSPNPVLNFQSEISGAFQGKGETLALDTNLSAKVILTGKAPSNSGNSPDGFVSFGLSGSGALNYDSATLTVSGCTSSSSPTGSTLKVTEPRSEIRYQYTPKFNPRLVYGSDQKLLASFCPVYDRSPASVTLVLDPGQPRENFGDLMCPGPHPVGGNPLAALPGLWQTFWATFHPSGTVTDWQIPGASSFAHKDFSQSLQGFTEKTKLDLNQPQ